MAVTHQLQGPGGVEQQAWNIAMNSYDSLTAEPEVVLINRFEMALRTTATYSLKSKHNLG